MPCKSLFADSKRDWSKLGDKIVSLGEKYAKERVKGDLRAAVAAEGYEIDFPMTVTSQKLKSRDALVFTVSVISLPIERKSDGHVTTTDKLFAYLDKGIKTSHIQFLPKGRVAKNGNRFFVSKRKSYNNPYEAKNWTGKVNDKHKSIFPVFIRGVIRSFLQGGS